MSEPLDVLRVECIDGRIRYAKITVAGGNAQPPIISKSRKAVKYASSPNSSAMTYADCLASIVGSMKKEQTFLHFANLPLFSM